MSNAWQNFESVYEHTAPTMRPRGPLSTPLPEDAARYTLEGQPDAKRPCHLVVLPGGTVPDSTVPALKVDAEAWRSLSAPAALMGGLTPEMVVVADMLYTYGPWLADEVNKALNKRDLKSQRFVSNVIERVQYEDISSGLKVRMLDALEEALRPFMAAGSSLHLLMDEWMQGVVWMDMRSACAHPLLNRLQKGGLGELRNETSTRAGYSSVRLLVSTLLHAGEKLTPLGASGGAGASRGAGPDVV